MHDALERQLATAWVMAENQIKAMTEQLTQRDEALAEKDATIKALREEQGGGQGSVRPVATVNGAAKVVAVPSEKK